MGPSRAVRTRGAMVVAGVVIALAAAAAVVGAASAGGTHHTSNRSANQAVNARPHPASGKAATPAPSAPLAPATTALVRLPPPGADTPGQTQDRPSTATPVFQAEVAALWQAVQTGDAAVALPVFFPQPAYLQVKALSNDAADYQNRLIAHFQLDLAAAHRLLGPAPASAHLISVQVPDTTARWILPGACSNRLGYWHVPGSRVVYEQDGVTRSFGIASLISWRGYWYVVHLGAVQPPSNQGVVDAPATGVGAYTPTGGC